MIRKHPFATTFRSPLEAVYLRSRSRLLREYRGIQTGFLGFDLKTKTARVYDEGKHDMDVTLLSDVGDAVAAILKHPEETANRYVYINTFYTSQSTILTTLEKQLGKFEFSSVGAFEANAEGTARIRQGDYGGVKDSLMGMMASGADGVNGEGKDNELLLGRKTREVKELDSVIARSLQNEAA